LERSQITDFRLVTTVSLQTMLYPEMQNSLFVTGKICYSVNKATATNTHLCTKPSSNECRTWALYRISRISWGVLSIHWPFWIGRSNILQNSVFVPK